MMTGHIPSLMEFRNWELFGVSFEIVFTLVTFPIVVNVSCEMHNYVNNGKLLEKDMGVLIKLYKCLRALLY